MQGDRFISSLWTVLAPGNMGNLMLLNHTCNLSHLVETVVIVGLTHMNVTHTITHRAGKLYKLQTASLQYQMRAYIFLGTRLCLNAQILTFIYFQFYLCAYILFVLFPCRILLLLLLQQSNFPTGIVNHLI